MAKDTSSAANNDRKGNETSRKLTIVDFSTLKIKELKEPVLLRKEVYIYWLPFINLLKHIVLNNPSILSAVMDILREAEESDTTIRLEETFGLLCNMSNDCTNLIVSKISNELLTIDEILTAIKHRNFSSFRKTVTERNCDFGPIKNTCYYLLTLLKITEVLSSMAAMTMEENNDEAERNALSTMMVSMVQALTNHSYDGEGIRVFQENGNVGAKREEKILLIRLIALVITLREILLMGLQSLYVAIKRMLSPIELKQVEEYIRLADPHLLVNDGRNAEYSIKRILVLKRYFYEAVEIAHYAPVSDLIDFCGLEIDESELIDDNEAEVAEDGSREVNLPWPHVASFIQHADAENTDGGEGNAIEDLMLSDFIVNKTHRQQEVEYYKDSALGNNVTKGTVRQLLGILSKYGCVKYSQENYENLYIRFTGKKISRGEVEIIPTLIEWLKPKEELCYLIATIAKDSRLFKKSERFFVYSDEKPFDSKGARKNSESSSIRPGFKAELEKLISEGSNRRK